MKQQRSSAPWLPREDHKECVDFDLGCLSSCSPLIFRVKRPLSAPSRSAPVGRNLGGCSYCIKFFLALESYSELVLEETLLLKQIWTDTELRQQFGAVFFCPCRGECTARSLISLRVPCPHPCPLSSPFPKSFTEAAKSIVLKKKKKNLLGIETLTACFVYY